MQNRDFLDPASGHSVASIALQLADANTHLFIRSPSLPSEEAGEERHSLPVHRLPKTA